MVTPIGWVFSYYTSRVRTWLKYGRSGVEVFEIAGEHRTEADADLYVGGIVVAAIIRIGRRERVIAYDDRFQWDGWMMVGGEHYWHWHWR